MRIDPRSLTFKPGRLYHASSSTDKTSFLLAHAVLTLAPFSLRVWSVWSVSSVWLNQTNQIDQTDQRNETDAASALIKEGAYEHSV